MQPVAVKWIFQKVRDKRGVELEAGQKPTLVVCGKKHMMCVAMAHPIRVLKRMAADFDKYRAVMDGKEPYDIAKAVERYEDNVKKHGITVSARRLLDRVRAQLGGQDLGDLNEDEYENEEELSMFTAENPAPVADGEATVGTADEGAAPVVKVKKTRKTTAAKVAKKTATTSTTSASSKEKDMKATKKAKGKTAAKAKGKTNGAAKANGKSASAGAGGFRAGTKKEKAFIEFKGYAKEYAKLERGGKGEYAEKLAKKVGVEVTTMKSWIGGQFTAAIG